MSANDFSTQLRAALDRLPRSEMGVFRSIAPGKKLTDEWLDALYAALTSPPRAEAEPGEPTHTERTIKTGLPDSDWTPWDADPPPALKRTSADGGLYRGTVKVNIGPHPRSSPIGEVNRYDWMSALELFEAGQWHREPRPTHIETQWFERWAEPPAPPSEGGGKAAEQKEGWVVQRTEGDFKAYFSIPGGAWHTSLSMAAIFAIKHGAWLRAAISPFACTVVRVTRQRGPRRWEEIGAMMTGDKLGQPYVIRDGSIVPSLVRELPTPDGPWVLAPHE